MKKKKDPIGCTGCNNIHRRTFLADWGMGFTGLVLGAMLHRDGVVRASAESTGRPPDEKPHFPPKAKNVIWLFMIGGVSHVETFDPKPALNKYGNMTIEETPYKDVLQSPLIENVQQIVENDRHLRKKLFPLQVGFRKRGQSGIEISDWWSHLGDCVDDLSLIRSVWTTDNDHGAQLQFHTGRHLFDGVHPSIGAWVHYGLGSLNENLPAFVVLGDSTSVCCGGRATHGADYLGPEHSGVRLEMDPKEPLPFAFPGSQVYREEQARQFELVQQLNQAGPIEYPEDPAMRARIQSYELAFRMQTSIPELFQFSEESPEIHHLYGLDQENTRPYGQTLLTARHLVERGVRFVQVFHGANGGAGKWDAHSELKKTHGELCASVDKPIAGLLKDLKQRGLLEETVVVWASEFGRTPGIEGDRGGRDHHPFAFTVWMAGGGIKGGVVHGATDELGFHAVENRHYVTDIHATLLHQLGLIPQKLDVPGHKRLQIDYGSPIREIIG